MNLTTLKTFARKFSNDWSMNLAAMLSYNLITTIFPILLAILTIASYVLGILSPGAFHNVADAIAKALPSQVQSVIKVSTLLKNLGQFKGPLTIVSIVGLIWGGSNLFSNMENAFSIVFRTRDRDFIPQKVMAVGMVIILAILLPVSVAASSLVTAGSQAFHKVLPGPLGLALTIVGPLTSIGILWILFLSIYIVVPNVKVPFRDAWRGAIAAAILFGLLQILFPLYFKVFLSGNTKYGATALAVLVVIVWLWFFALITLIGAQINAVAVGIPPTRYDLPRTLCMDYQEHTATPTAARSPSTPRASTGGPLHMMASALGHAAALPLRLLALLFWMAMRPIVQRKDQDRGRGAAR